MRAERSRHGRQIGSRKLIGYRFEPENEVRRSPAHAYRPSK
jgi:hypothetical protein